MRHVICNNSGDIDACHSCESKKDLIIIPARKKDRVFIGCTDTPGIVCHATCDMEVKDATDIYNQWGIGDTDESDADELMEEEQ